MQASDPIVESIHRYLDFINPLAPIARQAAKRIAKSPEDEKLTEFEAAFAMLCDKLVAWVREGFWMFLNAKDSSPAEDRLRKFLEPRLGHQIEYPSSSVYVNPWLQPSEPADKTIVWWVAEVSVGEGYVISTPQRSGPPEDTEDMTEELYQQLEPLNEI